MTTTIQYALAIESFMNLLGAIPFLLYPGWCLSFVIGHSSPSLATKALIVNPDSATLFQVYACLVITLTVPLLLCIPNRPGVVEKRIVMFQTLCVGETLLIALLLWKALNPDSSGFSRKGLVLSAMSLSPYLFWRFWALLVEPDLLSDGTELEKKHK